MANVPAYDSTKFSFGPGIIYLGALGTTPLIDVGAVKGDAEFSAKRTPLEVFQGSPQSLVKQYFIKEEVQIKFTGIEWNFDALAYAMGAGITTATGPVSSLEFGGSVTVTERALRFLHIMPDGSTLDLHLFRAQGAGEVAMSLKETDIHEFPYTFKALEGTTDFAGAALAANKKLFKIIRTKAA